MSNSRSLASRESEPEEEEEEDDEEDDNNTELEDEDDDGDVPLSAVDLAEQRLAKTPLGRIEQSTQWQTFVVGVILLNTVVLALEADNPEPVYWDYVDNIFLSIFIVELALRLTVYRCNFFRNKNWGWNWFDFTVVMLGILDQFVLGLMIGEGNEQMAALVSSFRTIRLLRVLRAVRLFKNFPELNRLVMGLVNSVGSVVWIALMFFFLIFTSSIVVTSLVGKEPERFENPGMIRHWFGTIPKSMITLSIFLTCDDWSTPARMVNKVYGGMVFFWIWYVVMGAFLILSLLTGLMADQMMDAREDMTDEDTKADPNELETLLDRFQRRFGQGDSMGFPEFEALITKKKMQEALAKCGLKTVEASQRRWLFSSLDRDASGTLSFSEIKDAFDQIGKHSAAEGVASVLEVMKLEGRIVKLDRTLRDAFGEENGPAQRASWDHRLEVVHTRAAHLSERIRLLEADVFDFFRHVGYPAQA